MSGFIDTATGLAREHYDDAVLVRFDVEGVFPDGHADLTLDDSFSALYRFQSPSRSERPKDLPVGVKAKQNCIYYVVVEKSGVNPYPLDGWDCDYPLIGPPECTTAQVWQKAIKMGAPGENAVAQIGYWDNGKGKGRWHVTVGDAFSRWVEDRCQ